MSLRGCYHVCARLADAIAGTHPHGRLFHPQWLAIRAQRAGMRDAATFASGVLIDVGCGVKPYASWFCPRVDAYVGLEYPVTAGRNGTPASKVDVFADALALPLRDRAANTALLTEVLEHLPEPGRALEEIHRTLDADGTLILTSPMIYNIHGGPHDFFRFTPYGLESLLSRHGFRIVEMRPFGYFGSMLGMMINNFVTTLIWRSTMLRVLRVTILLPMFPLFFALVNVTGWAVDRLFKGEEFTIGHLVIARKRVDGRRSDIADQRLGDVMKIAHA